MKPSLFRNYILLSIVITIGALLLGFVSFDYVSQLQRERMAPPPNLGAFLARVMDQLDPQDHVRAFEGIRKAMEQDAVNNIWLVNAQGEVLRATVDQALPMNWADLSLPTRAYETARIRPEGLPGKEMKRPRPGMGFGGPLPGPPPAEIVRLSGEPAMYLAFEFKPRPPPGFNGFLILQITLLISIVAASVFTFGLISLHLRRKALMAEQVMKRMQDGDLKARFPVTKNDEVGRIMSLFNKMGDDIERLMEKTKQTEQARLFILQELAHDLRTPIASLKSMLETLVDNKDELTKELSNELMGMSLAEVNYFSRLVEDLLLLAQILEPQYHFPPQKAAWHELLQDEVEKLNLQQSASAQGKKLNLQVEPSLYAVEIMGDEHLLRRVFRNALQNSVFFATKNVNIRVYQENGQLHFLIEDDGPGFAENMLATFGERRISRFINNQKGNYLSVGLGSVIIKKVILAHEGQVRVRNRIAEDGRVSGAELLISLPVAS